MNYRDTRDYENLQKVIYPGVGQFCTPQMYPLRASDFHVDNWISFNFMRTCEEPEKHGVHFFIDDYQFLRVWKQPDAYISKLSQFQAVCTPDFSLYTDFPNVIQHYNHYRKHWIGRYWQSLGVRMIPTVGWSDHSSYDWCFDGDPVRGVVAVSSVGTQASKTTAALFHDGWVEMLKRLDPELIVFYGNLPDYAAEERSRIVHVPAFAKKWKPEMETALERSLRNDEDG